MRWYWCDGAGGKVAHVLADEPQMDWERWAERRKLPRNVPICGTIATAPWSRAKVTVRVCFRCLEMLDSFRGCEKSKSEAKPSQCPPASMTKSALSAAHRSSS